MIACFTARTQAIFSQSEVPANLEFVLENGDSLTLDDMKDQVIYLSFWAGWCKPCLEGFRKYAEVRSRLEELGVVLLNVSIDAGHSLWLSNLEKHDPLGTNALITNMNEARDSYQLYSIPAYFIIGKDGHFRYLSDDPDRDINQEFIAFLNE